VADFKELGAFCGTAATFWRNNTLAGGDRVILVEAMSQDLRVTLRNLTLANALRRVVPAKLVVLTGADKEWLRTVWTYFDKDVLIRLARAYGADDVFDIHELVDNLASEHPPARFTIAGHEFHTADLTTGIDPDAIEDVVHATAARVYQAPRIGAAERKTARYDHIRVRSLVFSQLYDAMFSALDAIALVTGYVDYDHWGLAVESARRFGVAVIHVQSTGTFKAYAVFPETARGGGLTYRGELTKHIGEYFDQQVWSRRKELQHTAELTTWRNKTNLGRPAWWRGRGDISAMEIRTNAEREVLRRHAMDRFGFDRGKPVVAVYNHMISDALKTNVEIFPDLGAWFSETAAFAAGHPDVNWLFIDHPSQDKYDATDFIGGVASLYPGQSHMGFVHSWDISKNLMWSLVDLGITVRGSISNELPAFGIPCVQAGWSEWSELGFSRLASSVPEYWDIVSDCLEALLTGRPLLTEEQIEKARLWMWFYRSATDVPSVFLQHWELGEGDGLFHTLRMTMQYVETDNDPVFESVRRMWTRKEPFLSRLDLSALEPGTLEVSTGDPGRAAATDPDATGDRPRFLTAYDRRVPELSGPVLSRGDDPALQVVDGLARGASLPGRFTRSPGLIGIKTGAVAGAAFGTVPVTVTFTLDDASLAWWNDRVPASVEPRTPEAARVLLIRSQGKTRTAVVVDRAGKGPARHVTASFELDCAELDGNGLLVLEFTDPALPSWAASAAAPSALVGIAITSVALGQSALAAAAEMSLHSGLFVLEPGRRQWRLRAVMTQPSDLGPAGAKPIVVSSTVPPRPPDSPVVAPSQHTLPPPEPKSRVGRMLARTRLRFAAEARINGAVADSRPPRPPEGLVTAHLPALPSPVSPAADQAPAESPDPLIELIADLARENRIRVRAVSLTDGVEATLAVTRTGDHNLDVVLDRPLTEPVLARLEIVEDELVQAPELRRYGVVWHIDTR
jgi:hypothetical protein